ncbi:hypothetical protein [Candidatus Similichlamydia epinepheli]|uniref:hypothetical protein n=1 Tax=Candidatus Similichlamydia epinepheli TaxID=1903953 RepID=UPI000D3A906C|nr:hypothetical protein [Candidatus Similichlamydia epinepheli]
MKQKSLIFFLILALTSAIPTALCLKFVYDSKQASDLSNVCRQALRDLSCSDTSLHSNNEVTTHWVKENILPLIDRSKNKNVGMIFKKEQAKEFFDDSSYMIYTLREPVELRYSDLPLLIKRITPHGGDDPSLFLISFALENEIQNGLSARIEMLQFIVKEIS